MPSIIVPRRHLAQPQGRVELAPEWGARVVQAQIGDNVYDVKSGVFGVIGGGVQNALSSLGPALNPTTTAGRYVDAIAPDSADFSFVSVVQPASVSGNQQICALDDSAAGLRRFQFRSNGTSLEFIRFNTAPAAFTASLTSVFSVGVPVAVVGVTSGANVSVYARGRFGSAIITGTPASWNLGAGSPRWFERFAAGSAFEHSSKFSALRVIILGGLSSEEARALESNPWQLFRRDPVRLYFDVGGGGATSLVIQGATHGHAADVLTLTSSTALTVSDATHSHVADALTLSIGTSLSVADSSHAHAAESLAMTTDSALAIADALHAQAADNLTLTASGAASLTVQDASHSHSADALTLTTLSVLAVADASHAHTADNIDLSGAPSLAVQGATHGHTADGLALTLDAWLAINSAIHATRADNVILGIPGGLLPPVSCTGTHALSASMNAVHGLAASVAASTRIASDVTTTVRPL